MRTIFTTKRLYFFNLGALVLSVWTMMKARQKNLLVQELFRDNMGLYCGNPYDKRWLILFLATIGIVFSFLILKRESWLLPTSWKNRLLVFSPLIIFFIDGLFVGFILYK